jgi:Na+/H+-dicarboxylate symporter
VKANLSIKLILIILFVGIFGHFLPLPLKSALYALSLTLKEILLTVLPFIIFSCLMNGMLIHQKKAFIFVIALFSLVCFSNFLSTTIAYFIGKTVLPFLHLKVHFVNDTQQSLPPLWSVDFSAYKIRNEWALLAGFISGTLFSLLHYQPAVRFNRLAQKGVTAFLEKGFVPLLPLFMLGFLLKMQNDGILTQIIQKYLPLMGLLALVNILYLSFLFLVVARFKLGTWVQLIKSILPAGIMGFSTMSSMAALPVTISVTEHQGERQDVIRAVLPTTVNIHLVGDSIGIPLMALALLTTFGYPLPSPEVFFLFASFFVLYKFSVAAVPGGGILVMLPILQQYLGFNNEMSSIITALYFLFDPLFTSTNVMGNSAFALLISRVFHYIARWKNK